MTFEELKAEADRQGYRLIKKSPYINLSRCPTCGKYPKQWYGENGTFFKCCENVSKPSQTEKQAKIRWNDEVDPDWRNR